MAASTTIKSDPGAKSQRIGLTGWGTFAAVTLIVLGAVNVINGFTAIQHSSYYRSDIVYNNLTFWGWMFLIWGALQLVAGALVLGRSTMGYYLGVSLALVAAILWFFMIFAAPIPALTGILLSMAVLFALTRGSEEAF
jgi:hypothetical protein